MRNIILISIFVLNFTAIAWTAPQDEFNQLTEEIQKNSGDYALREKIIKYVQTMVPRPQVPQEAKRPFMKGVTFQKEASSVSDYELAISAYKEALLLAPWWPEAIYNMALAQEGAGKFDDAIQSLNLYLLTGPKDAEETENRVYQLQAKQELTQRRAAEQEAKKAEEAKPDFSGIWKEHDNPTCWTRKLLISGREITILNLCGERTEVYGTGTVDGRNFEGSSNSGYGIRYKGSLSEDNKTITFSYIRPQWSKWETATWTRVSK